MAEEEFDRQLMCDEPEVIQKVIDISSQMLISLRNLCETRAELTQHEIRTLEVSNGTLFIFNTKFIYLYVFNLHLG
jgi:hypothetical protein